MPEIVDDRPHLVVVQDSLPCRHSGWKDAVLDEEDQEQLWKAYRSHGVTSMSPPLAGRELLLSLSGCLHRRSALPDFPWEGDAGDSGRSPTSRRRPGFPSMPAFRMERCRAR